MININDTVHNHYQIHKNASLLDVLIEFDKFLDDLNVYSYENWMEGEIVDGPHLSRYWCEVSIMYPYKQMPNPMGAERLTDRKCKVSFREDHYNEPRRIKTPDDYEPGTKKPKIDEIPVWVVKIRVPKKYVMIYDKNELDQEEIVKGEQKGLNDETRQSGNASETDIWGT